jgi:hypothetical protein
VDPAGWKLGVERVGFTGRLFSNFLFSALDSKAERRAVDDIFSAELALSSMLFLPFDFFFYPGKLDSSLLLFALCIELTGLLFFLCKNN